MTARIVPETILSELRELWLGLAKADAETGQAGLLRSCTMTLIVVTDQPDGDSLDQTLAELMQEHPSRTIVLRLVPEGSHRLHASVRAHCWRPFGSRQQICCELIVGEFSRDRLAGVVSLLQGLLVPDLPVVFWVRSERLATAPEFRPLLPLAWRVIVDSMLARNPAEAIAAVRTLSDQGRSVADLAWTRTTPWRKMMADLFDGIECRKRLASIREITVVHLGNEAPPSALYLGAWLARGLGGQAKVRYRTADQGAAGAEPQGSIHSVRMSAGDYEIALTVADTTAGTRQIELKAGTLQSRLVLPARGETALMHEELQITGRDQQFHQALFRIPA